MLKEVFYDGLFRLLLDERFESRQVASLLEECQTIEYAATADRRMIGSVNELVKEAQFWLGQLGHADNSDLAAINQKLNSIPMKHIAYRQAIEATRVTLASK